MSSPSTPTSWSAVATLGVGAFALVTAEFLPAGLLPRIAQELALTDGQAGLMITIPGGVAACSALMTMSIAKRFDRRRVLLALLALLVVSDALVACASSLSVLLLGRVALGVAVGGFWTVGVSLGPRLRPDAVGRATAIVFSGVTLGTVAGVPLGTLVGGWFGWRVAFAVSAALALLIVATLMRLLPSIPAGPSAGLANIPVLLKRPKVRFGLVASVFIFTGQFAAYTYIAPFLIQVSGIGTAVLSGCLLAYGIAGVGGNLVCGWLAERSVQVAILGTSLLLAGAVTLLLFTGGHPSLALLTLVAWGFGFGMLPIAMQSWIFRAAPDALESAAALFVATAQVAVGVGAWLGGVAADRYGIRSAFWVGAAFTMAGAVWVLAMFLQRRSPGFSRGRLLAGRRPGGQ